mmetsp:Transcript_17399/g.29570  ORF Transcript_17399/g.29570 Transcript_17399/m.29570 type:complete len:84 (-) Transcript_17399:2195-2446(-)
MVAERLKGLDGDRLFKHFHLVEALGITPEPSKLAHEDRLVFAAQQLSRGDHMAQGRDLGFAGLAPFWLMIVENDPSRFEKHLH